MQGQEQTAVSVDREAGSQDLERRVDRLIVGAIDLHCHSGPSVMPRNIDHIEAIREASQAGLRAVLFKDHYYSVTPIAALLQKHYGDLNVTLLSGVPLNNTSGGLNRYAVDHGLKLGARVVWMPTFSAANHIRHDHRHTALPTSKPMLPPTMLTVVDDMGRIKDEVKFILDQIAEHDAVLSAGHLHISEIWPLFEEAVARGVKRRMVQHPTFVIDASLKDIKELATGGAFIEHSLCMFVPESRFKIFGPPQLDELVQAGGFEQTILGSDLGQVGNPSPVTGMRSVIRMCIELGYDDAQIRKLIGGNAARLTGIDV